jgi:hypothetical protein
VNKKMTKSPIPPSYDDDAQIPKPEPANDTKSIRGSKSIFMYNAQTLILNALTIRQLVSIKPVLIKVCFFPMHDFRTFIIS